MRWRSQTVMVALLIALALPAPAPAARCVFRCGVRIARCVLDRGGVDGREQDPCRRSAVRACRTHRNACLLPDHDQFAATVASVVAVEAPAHRDTPLCAASLPAAPVASITDAIAVGRDTAAGLVGTTDPTFRAVDVVRGGAFEKFFLQGTFGHGAAFVPLGNVVLALARPARAVIYSGTGRGPAYAVVGIHAGTAVGIVLTYCPAP